MWRESGKIGYVQDWVKFPEGNALILSIYEFPYNTTDGSLGTKNQLDPLSCFDTIPACDGHVRCAVLMRCMIASASRGKNLLGVWDLIVKQQDELSACSIRGAVG